VKLSFQSSDQRGDGFFPALSISGTRPHALIFAIAPRKRHGAQTSAQGVLQGEGEQRGSVHPGYETVVQAARRSA